MASGVNVKMGVTGVSQFKQNINTARQSLKTLDAQLALNEKQFKASGDAETYMQEKSELLKVKLEEQKSIAANCEKALAQMASNGVDKASKSYQEMQRQLLEAKGAMLDTETAMQGVTDETDKAADNVSEMNSQLKNIGNGVSYDNVTKGISAITGAMQTALSKALELGRAIVREVLGAGNWADDLNTRASVFNIDQDLLQRMDKVAMFIDTPVEAIINAKKKLNMALAAEGQKDMGAWAALGINPNDAEDAEDLFWKTGEAIRQMTDEKQRDYYANELLGRSWSELNPLFEAGREKYEEALASQSTVTQEQVDNLQALNDKYNELVGEFETIKRSFFGEIAQPLTGVMETITDLLKKFNEYLKSPEGKAAMEKLGETISKLVEDLVNVDPDAVVNGIAKAIDSISSGLDWIKNNKDLVIGAITAIGMAFAGLKAAELAVNIGKIVNGFNQLKNGSPNVPTTSGGGGGGGPDAASIGGSGAAAAGGAGFWAKLSGWAGAAGESALAAAPVIGVAGTLVAAMILNNEARDQAAKKYDDLRQRAEEAAQGMGAAAEADAQMVADMANILGYVKDKNGNYVTGAFGTRQFGDWGAIGNTAEDFAGLRGVEQAKLYNKIRQYSPYTASGWDTISLLDKVRAGTAEEWEKTEVVSAIAEAYTQSLENGGAMDAYDRMTQAAEESSEGADSVKDAGADISDAAKALPKETAAAVSAALNGASVVINGGELTAVVGSLMAGVLARYQV